MKTVYDFTVKDRKGNEVSLSEYQGKVLLIVNTATGCGFTPHYEPLEEMYKDLREKGLEILDFPCNQFASLSPLFPCPTAWKWARESSKWPGPIFTWKRPFPQRHYP